MESVEPLLSVEDVTVKFGGITALDAVSFDVWPGQITGLIGPNGAGKTTIFNCLSRLYTPSSGSITFEGRSLQKVRPHEIAAAGIARTFQNAALFDKLTVLQNIMVGAHSRFGGNVLKQALCLPESQRAERRNKETAWSLIEFLHLDKYASQTANALPFPVRKRVELARALACGPKLLLLDEPAAGLNHDEVAALKEQIVTIRQRRSVTILLVEHHMNLVMAVSDLVVVLNFGKRIAVGPPAAVQSNEAVIAAYLGIDDRK